MPGHGEKLTRKQEAAIAALLSCRTIGEAGAAVGVSERTLRNWMTLPTFRAAYRLARRELVEGSIGRIQAATGTAVDTLVEVAKDGARDGDRVRAAAALLDHAIRGMELADVLHRVDSEGDDEARAIGSTGEVVKMLANRLIQLEKSELGTAEKSRLTATVSDALLRAIAVDTIEKRLEAIETNLTNRKEM